MASVQSLSLTRLGNQIKSLDTTVEFLVAFNEIIGSLDFFGEACAELDLVFINGYEEILKFNCLYDNFKKLVDFELLRIAYLD